MSKRPTILELVILFAQVGMSAFGGQVPVHLWNQLVGSNWLSEQEYLEAVNWSQCVPGCNGYLGWYFSRASGSFLATVALLIPGAVGLILVSTVLTTLPQQHLIQSVLSCVTATVVGILFGMTWKLARSSLTQAPKLLVAAITLMLVGFLRIPILPVLVIMGGLSWILNKQDIRDDEHPA